MILEIAELTITPGSQQPFEEAVQRAVHLFKRAKGCVSMRLERSIENPAMYLLVVGWETVEDHTVGFRGSEDFQQWRSLVGDYFAAAPKVQHTETVVAGF